MGYRSCGPFPRAPRGRSGPAYDQASVLARHVAPEPWRRCSTGDGATGPRLDDWALVELWRRQWAAAAQAWGHDLRVRRSVEDPSERASDVVFARRAGLALDALVQVAGSRWQIEAAFEAANGDGGWDDYAGRKWPAWKRHVTLALLAHACLVVVRPQEAQKGGPAASDIGGDQRLVTRAATTPEEGSVLP